MSLQLFNLIHSLSQGEKRHFSLHNQSYQKDQAPAHLLLFKHISQQANHDESTWASALPRPLKANQYHRLKNHLYELLLESLSIYSQHQSARLQTLMDLAQVEILVKKNLFAQADKRLLRAKKRAHQYSLTFLFLEIHEWERRLLRKKDRTAREEALAGLDRELDEHLKQVQIRNHYTQTYDQVLLLTQKRLLPNGAEAEAPDFHFDTPPGSDFETRLARELSLALDFQRKRRLKDANTHYWQAWELWQNHPHLMREHPDRLLKLTAALLYSCHSVGDLSTFQNLIAQLKDSSQSHLRLTMQVMLLNLQLLQQLNQGHTQKEIPHKLAVLLEKHLSSIPPSFLLPALTNLAIYFFVEKDYAPARSWLKQILDLKRGQDRRDLRELAHILYQICLLETQEWQLLPYALTAASRYIQKSRDLSHLERELFASLHKISRQPAERSLHLSHLKQTLTGLPEHPGSLGQEEVLAWLGIR